jgi:hypothetical protein
VSSSRVCFDACSLIASCKSVDEVGIPRNRERGGFPGTENFVAILLPDSGPANDEMFLAYSNPRRAPVRIGEQVSTEHIGLDSGHLVFAGLWSGKNVANP